MSNTKLSDDAKQLLSELKFDFTLEGGKLFNFDGVCVAIKPAYPNSIMAMVAVSFASFNEDKLRRKVGEFHALNKMDTGEYIQVPLSPGDFEDFAINFWYYSFY